MKNNYKVIINKIKCNYKIYTIKSLYKVITSQWNNKVITSFIQSTSFQNLFHLTYCILKLFSLKNFLLRNLLLKSKFLPVIRLGVGSAFLIFPFSLNALTLPDSLEQGSLIYGQTDPDTQMEWMGQIVPISPEGDFVFAIPQEANETETLILKNFLKKQEIPIKISPYPWPQEVVNGLEPAKVQLSPENQKRTQKEARLVQKSRQKAAAKGIRLSKKTYPLPRCFERPVSETARISSQFGAHRILNGIKKQGHSGTDYALPTGTPVYAIQDGIVLLAHSDLFYSGKTLLIDHGYGLVSSYSHLNQLDVQTGDFVKRGQKIGEIGMTGRATGPHLHFVITWKGIRVDPEKVLKQYSCPTKPSSL